MTCDEARKLAYELDLDDPSRSLAILEEVDEHFSACPACDRWIDSSANQTSFGEGLRIMLGITKPNRWGAS